ncbi:Myb-binding protein 1A [Ooceraea biroi]|uniref:Myb-binding protein 1A n=1 Tax=Ooceraea biroi TaxID=2015173 RepID=A0A026W610_OOCBI|nr:Myb-binding protein 1A [Ooceraea biroi]
MAEIKLDNLKRQGTDNKMNSPSVLDHFNKLKDSNNSVRLNAGVELLRHLSQYNAAKEDNKELNYALIRLIRSLGSTTVHARRGFYSTLTTFLTMHPEISVEKLLSTMNTQLSTAGSNAKSENADICMGRILLCGALIRSKLYAQETVEMQQQIIQILFETGMKRSYLSFLSSMFLSEFVTQLHTESMKEIMWPIIEDKLGIPWSEHTLDTFYLLLVVENKHPSLINHKFLKEHLGVKEIIAKESVEKIITLLTAIPRIVSHRHPVFKLFCEKLKSTELVPEFWKGIDQRFMKPSKSDEYIATEMLKLILSNITDKTVIPSLLSPNLLQHMLKRFSNCKKNNNDEVLTAFREVLHSAVSATNDKDMKTKTQLSILKKLILHSGDLMIEKKTGVKVIQIITGNLKVDGVKKLCELYRDIIENKIAKEQKGEKTELWTNAERSYIMHLLTRLIGHPEILSDVDWRLAQLTFLFKYGLCEVSHIGVELAPQFKDAFYRALDYKLPKLNDVRNLLSALVHDLNSKLLSNTMQLRAPLSDAASDAWKRVLDLIEKLEMNTKDVDVLPIFHTMNLHMGLQLFSDPEMAIMSINELQSCYERLTKKSKKHKKLDGSAMEEEPQWVEVVVDLLLSLLSRNNHLLRSLVGCVFPHVCPHLTPSSVYQILAVLDIKNDQSTLMHTKKNDDDDSSNMDSELDDDDDDNDDNDDDDDDNDDDEEKKVNGENSSEESESDRDENADEDETVTDKLRMAIRQALGDAAMQTDDDDIDVDQIDEEEGRRLDESLAAAFKILRENRKARSKKQEKTSQALTHFRIRVIDLLNIYLETCPSMAVTLDMLVPLFALLEFCIKDPHQKPLEHRVRNCLKKLSKVKKFKDTTNVDNTLLTTVLKALIEKGERSASICQEINDKLAECCTFLIRCMQQVDLSIEDVVDIYAENLTAFFKKRDCVLSSMLFKGVLQLCWEGNWQLVSLLVNYAFDSSIRYFRRSQALELLIIFYNNNRFLNMYASCDKKYVDMRIKLETILCKNTIDTLRELCDQHASKDGQSTSCNGTGIERKILQKFISHLFSLLRIVHVHHLPQAWDWQVIKTVLTAYRSQNNLSKDAKSAYSKLVAQIGTLNDSSMENNITFKKLTDISQNNGRQNNVKFQNGKTSESEEEEEEEKADKPQENTHDNNKKKNKSKQKDKKLLKKEARELRAKVMSENLELFKFSSVNLPENDVNMVESVQNGNSHAKSTDSKLSHKKRNNEQTTEENSKLKRRKKVINCV